MSSDQLLLAGESQTLEFKIGFGKPFLIVPPEIQTQV